VKDVDEEIYFRSIEEWRASLDASIRKEDGWLALAGLFWLHEGDNTFGSAHTNDIVLPDVSPPRLGSYFLDGGQVSLRARHGEGLLLDGQAATDSVLAPDISGDPTRISSGPLTMIVIRRGERLGIRLWDNGRSERQTFARRSWYPTDLAWRVKASFEAHDPPMTLAIPNVLGDWSNEVSAGSITFEREGRPHRLEAVQTEAGELWLIFADRTNDVETYPSGRFLICPLPEHGRVTVDFNRAYNPPCAFTEYATCPLPPRQNVLHIRVEAGERFPH
jgi:uncharacterized protein (DUF1684 family)